MSTYIYSLEHGTILIIRFIDVKRLCQPVNLVNYFNPVLRVCRLRYCKVMIVKYLLPYSEYKLTLLPRELIDLLVYALQLDEAQEILKYCQDVCIESCRTLWRSYMKYDRVQFNHLLVRSYYSTVLTSNSNIQILFVFTFSNFSLDVCLNFCCLDKLFSFLFINV